MSTKGNDMKKITKAMQACAQSLYNQHGCLKTSMVLNEAKDETSPLHAYFEWNDGVAAHKYRQAQARTFCKQVTILVKPHKAVEYLIHVPSESKDISGSKEGEYKAPSVIVKCQSEVERATAELYKLIIPLKRQVAALYELAAGSDIDLSAVTEAKDAIDHAEACIQRLQSIFQGIKAH